MVYISQCVSQKQLKRNFYNNYGKQGMIWLIFVKGLIIITTFKWLIYAKIENGSYRF